MAVIVSNNHVIADNYIIAYGDTLLCLNIGFVSYGRVITNGYFCSFRAINISKKRDITAK
jgi:hypothetical protein